MSIIIVNHNGGKFVLDCIDSVRKFTQNYEIILVDNASTDGSVQALNRLFPSVAILRNSKNVGFAQANNMGIEQSKGKYIVLMNSDVTATADWFDRLRRCAEDDSRIGVATPKLLRRDGRLDTTGHVFWFFDVDARNRGAEEQDNGQYDSYTELASCDFACALIKKDLLNQIGLLDEMFFLYHEDIDFCLRARLRGWRVIFCPSSRLYHYRGGSTIQARKRILYMQRHRYLLRLSLKSYSLRSLVQVLPHKQKQAVFFLLGALSGLKNRDLWYSRIRLDDIAGLFVAFLWNGIHLPLRERIFIQKYREVADEEIRRVSRLGMPGGVRPLVGFGKK